MPNRWLASAGLAAAAFLAAGCGSSSAGSGGTSSTPSSAAATASSPASSEAALKTAKISGATVLTNAGGFTLYWFAPDTTAKSNCNGSCAAFWPPVKGPAASCSSPSSSGPNAWPRTDANLTGSAEQEALRT